MNESIVKNLDKINNNFGVELDDSYKCWSGRCPIHNGDNPSSFVLYKHFKVGSWKCFTHQCHEKYGGDAIGFVRGLLSKNGEVSRHRAIKWCENFLKLKYEYKDKNLDNILTDFFTKPVLNASQSFKISLKEFDSKLAHSDYFINRGYQEETLKNFHIGYCDNKSKPFYDRMLVPHLDHEDNVIGVLGRSVYEKCDLCNQYHNPNGVCRKFFPKWRNSDNFPSYNTLYNFYRASQSINDTGLVLLVESAASVWRLIEAGFPMSLASFGAKFSPEQKNLLEKTQAHTIVVVPDAGKAGKILTTQVENTCKYTHNIVTISPSYDDDIGKLNIDTVKNILGPVVDKCNRGI